MDSWERCARRAIAYHVALINSVYMMPEVSVPGERMDQAKARWRLALFLAKLCSRDDKVVEWASAQSRGLRDVHQ